MADESKEMIYGIVLDIQSTLTRIQSDLDECFKTTAEIREILSDTKR